MGELTEPRHQHPVTPVEGVGDRCFPRPGAGGGVHEHPTGLVGEDLLQIGEQRQGQVGEIRRSVILLGHVHRAAHRVGDVGRAGNV
jgi:hypothetical protein